MPQGRPRNNPWNMFYMDLSLSYWLCLDRDAARDCREDAATLGHDHLELPWQLHALRDSFALSVHVLHYVRLASIPGRPACPHRSWSATLLWLDDRRKQVR